MMTARRWFPGLVALALTGALIVASPSEAQHGVAARSAAPVTPAAMVSPSPSEEAQFASAINGLRASKGLSQLQISGQLLGVARAWTEQMVANGQISHNPNLGAQVSGAWTKLGENVGVGYDVNGLMNAFINSPAHYANLVDPAWTYLAVGVTIASDGRIYTTHNFMALGGSAPPPPPVTSPPATAPPAPAVTTTTTTPPPPPPEPHPSEDRVTAVLDPLRSLEQG